MFKPLHCAVALVAGLASAWATTKPANADGYARASAARPSFTWSGFYIGMNGGYAWSDDRTVTMTETFEPGNVPPVVAFRGNYGSLSPTGGFAGFQAGANMQLGAAVLGVEVDGQWADIDDSSLATVLTTGALVGGLNYTVGTTNRVTKFGTIRPRFGIAFDRTLLYGTAGLAWGTVEHTMRFNDNAGFNSFDSSSGTHVGYVLGAGIEQAFSSNLSLKVEYQYIDLGSETYTAVERNGAGVVSNFRTNIDTQTDFHTVRIGLNYKLGGH